MHTHAHTHTHTRRKIKLCTDQPYPSHFFPRTSSPLSPFVRLNSVAATRSSFAIDGRRPQTAAGAKLAKSRTRTGTWKTCQRETRRLPRLFSCCFSPFLISKTSKAVCPIPRTHASCAFDGRLHAARQWQGGGGSESVQKGNGASSFPV